MKPNLVVSTLLLSACAWALPAHAEGPPVSVQLTIGTPPPPPPMYVAPQPVYAPPPVVVAAPPTMVWLPEFSGYVALGVAQPLFYLGGVYYYNSGGRWYTGPHYGGPWHPAARIPPGLRKFHDRDWERAQAHAHRYDRDPHWKRFHAAPVRPPVHAAVPGRPPYHPAPPHHGPQGGPPGPHPGEGYGPGPGRPDHEHGNRPDSRYPYNHP